MRRILVLAACLVGGSSVVKTDDPAPPTVDKLVEQLGSRSFAEREKATKALRERGPAALPAVRKALESKDEEVRKRA
jgi:HEAT repeat protein